MNTLPELRPKDPSYIQPDIQPPWDIHEICRHVKTAFEKNPLRDRSDGGVSRSQDLTIWLFEQTSDNNDQIRSLQRKLITFAERQQQDPNAANHRDQLQTIFRAVEIIGRPIWARATALASENALYITQVKEGLGVSANGALGAFLPDYDAYKDALKKSALNAAAGVKPDLDSETIIAAYAAYRRELDEALSALDQNETEETAA